ncbi:MAG: sigma 54-interacting transcriptional regulator [Bilophila sp.]
MEMFAPVSECAVEESYIRLLNHLPGLAYRCRVVHPVPPGSERLEYILEFASKGSYDLLGIPSEVMVQNNYNTIERMTHPDDLQKSRREIYDSIVAHQPYQVMYRLSLPSGRLKWVWDQGEGVFSANGELHYLEGLMMDISEQKFQELELKEENRQLKASVGNLYELGNIVGKSEAMRKVYNLIIKAAETDTNVIIYGETGSGKDLVAKAIHEYSARKGNYVPVNCGAIPEQLLESEFFGHTKGAFSGAHAAKEGYIGAANNGTLFLDEIGELPLHLQVKLLRAIENKMYTPVGSTTPKSSSFRLIAATNQDLSKMVLEKKMRSDFYYRVHVLSITLPSLRERQGDIPLLVEAYLERKGLSCSLPLQVRLAMEHYDWPGNVRELHNFLDRYTAFGDVALESLGEAGKLDLLFPALPHEGLTLENATLQLEERMIQQALDRCRWRRGDAAEALGLNLRTLQRKMKRLGMGK